jgi:phosphoglycolate phosphatase
MPEQYRFPLKALVFDFDGTLATLTLDFGEMRRRIAALAASRLPQTPTSNGRPVLEWIEALALEAERYALDRRQGKQEAQAAGQTLKAECAELVRSMELEAAGQGELFPFARPLLEGLRRAGLGAAIITRNCGAAVRSVFPDAERYCDCLLAREDVRRVKPDPEHLLTALARLGTPASLALMVGDHPMDIEAGRRAGTRTAGVASGAQSLAALQTHAPDYLAENAASLLELLAANGAIPRL